MDFSGKGTFHVLDPPEKTKHGMKVLRPVLNSSRQDAFKTVELKKTNVLFGEQYFQNVRIWIEN